MVTMLKPRQLRELKPTLMDAGRPGATDRITGRPLQRIRDRILTRDAGRCRCAECIRTGALKLAAEVDHRTPLWEGGREDDANRYSIHPDCHKAKTACESVRRSGSIGWQCTCLRCAKP